MTGRLRCAHLAGALTALVSACTATATGLPFTPHLANRLGRLAAAAARQAPIAPLRPGQFRYLRWSEATLVTSGGPAGEFSRLEYRTAERWARADGSGRWRATCHASVFVGPRDRARWRADGSPRDRNCSAEDEPAGRGMLAPGVPLADRLGALPTNAGRLETRLRAAARPSQWRLDDGQMFTLVCELLQVPEAPPSLRAGLIRVVARLRGVGLAEPLLDPAGRPGVALAQTVGAPRLELILSPRTTAVLGERTVIEKPVDWADARPGQVLGWVAYLDSAVVDAIPPPVPSGEENETLPPAFSRRFHLVRAPPTHPSSSGEP